MVLLPVVLDGVERKLLRKVGGAVLLYLRPEQAHARETVQWAVNLFAIAVTDARAWYERHGT